MELTLTGIEVHICPTLVKEGRKYMSHYCDVIVASFLRHLESHVLGGATNIITLWPAGHELLNYG